MVTATANATRSRRGTATILSGLTDAQRSVYELIPDEIGFVPNELFDSPEAEEMLFGESSSQVEVPVWTHFPEVVEDVLPSRPGVRRSAPPTKPPCSSATTTPANASPS